MQCRKDQAFQTDSAGSRHLVQRATHGFLHIAVLAAGHYVSVRANHGVHIGMMEVVGEDVDRIAAEQLESGGLQQTVPILLEPDRRGEFFRAPQHAHHLAISAKTCPCRGCRKPLHFAADGQVESIPVWSASHHEPVQRLSGIEKGQAAAELCGFRIVA